MSSEVISGILIVGTMALCSSVASYFGNGAGMGLFGILMLGFGITATILRRK